MPKTPKGDDPGTDPVDTPGWPSGAIDPMAFKHLSDMSSQGISMVELNGAIYYANATLRAKLGLAPDETLESHNFFEFYTTAEQVRLREEVIPGVLRDGQWTGELRLLSRAGNSRRVVQNVFLVRGGNSPQAFANVITDITRTEAVSGREQQLLQAQAIAHLGHWTSYAQTGELEWSDEIYRIFGHEPGAFVPSQARFFEAVHPDDLELVTLVVEGAFKRGEVYRVDHRILRPDGETRWVRDEAQVEFDAEGRPLRLTGTVQDISERKQIEEALIDARDEAERASRAKSEFLSHVSHELRTPLNAILGFAQLLELDDATLTADQRDGVQQILHGGRLLLELIDGLLELGRIEAGRVELVLEKHDARDLIEECIRLVTPIAENAGVTIRFRRPESQIMVRADRTRFKEVVLNLLANAVTSNHPGGWVAVAGEPDGDQLRLSLRDNGAGIAPEDLPQLFEPFSRLNSRPGGEPLEGAGLGLPIARRLVEMMGGALRVESVPGEGSTWHVSLPRSLEGGAEPETERPEAEIGAATAESGTILYVDDDEASCVLMDAVLRNSPYRLVTAASGEEGLEHLKSGLAEKPVMIFLDINLPGISGFDVLSHLRQDPALADVPIMAMSAGTSKEQIDRALMAGFSRFLQKPVMWEVLEAVLPGMKPRSQGRFPESQ